MCQALPSPKEGVEDPNEPEPLEQIPPNDEVELVRYQLQEELNLDAKRCCGKGSLEAISGGSNSLKGYRETESEGSSTEDKDMRIPPLGILTDKTQPNEDGTELNFHKKLIKRARKELQTRVTQQLMGQESELDQAQGKKPALMNHKVKSKVAYKTSRQPQDTQAYGLAREKLGMSATSRKKSKGSSKIGFGQRTKPLNIREMLDKELLAETDGILLESEEDSMSSSEDHYTSKDPLRDELRVYPNNNRSEHQVNTIDRVTLSAQAEPYEFKGYSMATLVSTQRQLHPKEGGHYQFKVPTLGHYIKKLYPE